MTKRSSLLMLAFVLVLSMLLTACGSGGAGGSESPGKEAANPGAEQPEVQKEQALSGTITVWVHPYVSEEKKNDMKAVFDGIISEYNSKYPDVKVKLEEIPWKNREQKILTALAAGNGPDVFYQLPDQIPQFASKDVLEPLTPYMDDNQMDDFTPGALAAATYQNTLYALPILQEAQLMFYNADIIKEIGEDPSALPQTWHEFNVWAEKAVAKGYYARDFSGGAACCNGTLYPILWQQGGDIIDGNGEIVINNEAGVRTFQMIKDMYDKGWIPKDSISNQDQFAEFLSGKMLAVWGSGFTQTVLKEEKFNYAAGPPLKGAEQASFGTVGMFAVPKNSKNKQAAVEFIKVLTNTEAQKKFNKLATYIPTRKSASSIYEGDKDMEIFMEVTAYTRPGVMSPVARTIMPKIQAEIAAMLEGGKSPQEAADAAAKAIQDDMNKS
ncbi:sugar ABC transporter substrate-binding protein [Paenibacillus thiaminolyticus]|uniref:ABC transporter substrate-binding protein n=1 Tax=Paenibacillus thiaminolyticus TaxID=49283 RepID=UPI003D2AB763